LFALVPAQPVDATLILNRRERECVLMSEKCRRGLTGARETGALASLAAGDLEGD
jgi:hypothetical protein